MYWRFNLEFKNDLDILDKLRIKKLSWHIGQTAWIIRRHLDKASGSMSSQTNLLKEDPSRAFKNKDATQGSGKLWATQCWKLRGYVQEVLPSTGPGPLFFPRLLLLANARGRWADAALHMAALMSCSWAQSKKVRLRTENWAAVLRKKIWDTGGSKAEPKSSVFLVLGKAHTILEYISSDVICKKILLSLKCEGLISAHCCWYFSWSTNSSFSSAFWKDMD